MALWKDNAKDSTTARTSPDGASVDVAPRAEVSAALHSYSPSVDAPRMAARAASAESVIGADLAIDGTISGAGSVRLAGRFTGDVTVDGMVTIEAGARLAGGVLASAVTIAGELEGNVVRATRVDIVSSGIMMGDLKADTLTLAAGARLRGHVECGWVEAPRGGPSSNGRTAPSPEPASDA